MRAGLWGEWGKGSRLPSGKAPARNPIFYQISLFHHNGKWNFPLMLQIEPVNTRDESLLETEYFVQQMRAQ